MLNLLPQLEDAAYKLCFLYSSAQRDPVFFSGALLGAALAHDCGLPFPDCLPVEELLVPEVLGNPLARWLAGKLHLELSVPAQEEPMDSQVADLHRCLAALDQPDALSLSDESSDATGVAARQVLSGTTSDIVPHLPRVHPLWRRRWLEKFGADD